VVEEETEEETSSPAVGVARKAAHTLSDRAVHLQNIVWNSHGQLDDHNYSRFRRFDCSQHVVIIYSPDGTDVYASRGG